MLTTTSLDGVFWRPSLGSFDTRTFTMFVAARTKKQGWLFLDKCSDLSVISMSVPAQGDWNKRILPMWSLLEECLARFLRRPVRGFSSMSLLVSNRSSRMGSILSCSITTPLSTDDHWQRGAEITWVMFCWLLFLLKNPMPKQPKNQSVYFGTWIYCTCSSYFYGVWDLTLASPAVIFCRAPMAASRLVELLSLLCRTSLYNATTLGCHSHSAPLGCRDTSDSIDRLSLRCHGGGERERKFQLLYSIIQYILL